MGVNMMAVIAVVRVASQNNSTTVKSVHAKNRLICREDFFIKVARASKMFEVQTYFKRSEKALDDTFSPKNHKAGYHGNA